MKKVCLSMREAAQLLSISKSYGYDLARQGIIPSIRLGRRTVVPLDKLKEKFAQLAEQAEAERQ